MSEENVEETQAEVNSPSELDLLKQRADLMGLSYRANIGIDKLRAMVNSKIEDNEDNVDHVLDADQFKPIMSTMKPTSTRALQLRNAKKLVRVRVASMDPNKRDYTGDLFTFGNRSIKSFTKMIPFNAPWIIPEFMARILETKQMQLFRTVTRSGHKVREGYMARAYSVERMPDPTQQEIDRLRTKQAAQNTLDVVG